jgi:predicted Fe-Mo cluster-binding NifX family protein
MKTAFSVWEQRIAPVFDTARQVHLVESAGGRVKAETNHAFSGDDLSGKVVWLTEKGVGTLVCGAVSRTVQEQLTAGGIKVVPFVAGDLREVIRAWQDGTLHGSAFTMPGCCGRRRMRRQHGGGRCCAARKTI